MKCLVVLCGCGHLDGSEIREAVLVLLELDRLGVSFFCCAPDEDQVDVVDHVTRTNVAENRNLLAEAARIARGDIVSINGVDHEQFDMVIFPGGFGVAKNFSDLTSSTHDSFSVKPEIKSLVLSFHKTRRAIGAVCIAPAVIAAALRDQAAVRVTLGEDTDGIIKRAGGLHVPCETDSFVQDKEHAVFSCSAYMRNDRLHRIHDGIKSMIAAMAEYTKQTRK